MVDIEDLSNVCQNAAEQAYEALPDLGEQDQDKIWENVAKQIGCQRNIQMNDIAENNNLENTEFEDLVTYYKNAAVHLKFEEMIAEINECATYELNLNEEDESYFNDIMTSLCPSNPIEFEWSYEINESDGQFCINLSLNNPTIRDIAGDLQLINGLECAFAAKIEAKYYQISKCKCGYLNLESETPAHQAFYKNNTNYHSNCGYPAGVLDYLMIVEHKSGSSEEQENQIETDEIPNKLKSGDVWMELKEMYGLEEPEKSTLTEAEIAELKELAAKLNEEFELDTNDKCIVQTKDDHVIINEPLEDHECFTKAQAIAAIDNYRNWLNDTE